MTYDRNILMYLVCICTVYIIFGPSVNIMQSMEEGEWLRRLMIDKIVINQYVSAEDIPTGIFTQLAFLPLMLI
uniref:RSN1_TM domain-containing protein n=1 Tax=Heterorhabditis bacteriophora TaxID=37862 RepID=A0A1I7X0I6_HETBA